MLLNIREIKAHIQQNSFDTHSLQTTLKHPARKILLYILLREVKRHHKLPGVMKVEKEICNEWAINRQDLLADFLTEFVKYNERWMIPKYFCSPWMQESPSVSILVALKFGKLEYINQQREWVVDFLIENLYDPDKTISNNSRICLLSLTRPESIDQLCTRWIKGRFALDKIIFEAKYVAQKSTAAKILTTLKNKPWERILPADEEEMRILSLALDDWDKEIATNAKRTIDYLTSLESEILTALKNKHWERISSLDKEGIEILLLALDDSDEEVVANANQAIDYLSRSEDKALCYFFTEQWHKYKNIDFDQSILANIFELDSTTLERIKQSGPSEWLPIIYKRSQAKKTESMTDLDWLIILKTLSKNNDYPEIWRLVKKAPLLWAKSFLRQLRNLDFIENQQERQYVERLKLLASRCFIDRAKLKSFPLSGKSFVLGKHIRQQYNQKYNDAVKNLMISADGNLLISQSIGGIKLWELPSGELLCDLTEAKGSEGCSVSLAVNPQGTILASGYWSNSSSKSIKLWALPSGKLLKTLEGGSQLTSLAISPDGKFLVSGGKLLRVWFIPSGTLFHTLESQDSHGIQCLAISPKDNLLASGSYSGTNNGCLKLWSLSSGRLIKTIEGINDGGIDSLIISPDGNLLVSGNRALKLWRLPSGKLLRTLVEAHPDHLYKCLAINQKGTLLATGGWENSLVYAPGGREQQLWELPSGERYANSLKLSHNPKNYEVNTITFNSESTLLATGSSYDLGGMWRLPSGEQVPRFGEATRGINCLVVNQEGSLLASGHTNGDVILTRLGDLSSLHRLSVQHILEFYPCIKEASFRIEDSNTIQHSWITFIKALSLFWRDN
jgi:WD40 repeat protein